MSSGYGKYGADRSAVYPTPPGAIIVSTSGSDTTGAGTVGNPYRTIKKAVAEVAPGGTIAVRGGSYHEGALHPQDLVNDAILIPVTKPGVTIQNYSGEEVWLDGSQVVTGWSAYDTDKWRAPLALSLDRTPTQVRGSNSSFYGSYTLVEFPIAHWPEMVLIDGAPQTQVQTLAEVVPGTFFVEGSYPNSDGVNKFQFQSTHYVLGTNPSGKEVRVARLGRALTNASDNTTVRGIGFRRYACALPDIGAIYANTRPGLAFENCSFEDFSDLALNLTSPGWTIRKCTFLRCGRQAINAGNRSDNGLLEWSYFEKTNLRRFNYGPIGGNIKLGMQWNSTVRYNRMDDTRGHGIWADECCYKTRVYGNYMTNTYGAGVLVEISGETWIVDNIIIDNGINSNVSKGRPHDGRAIWVLSSQDSHVWHNTIINPEVGITFSEGYRKPLNADGKSWRSTSQWGDVFGQDKGRGDAFYQAAGYADTWDFYRQKMTWDNAGAELANNVFAGTAGISDVQSVFIGLACETGLKGATQMVGHLDKPNVFARLNGTTPLRFANSIKHVAGTAPSPTVVYFNMTGNGHEGSPSWATTMGDTQSTLTTSNVIADDRQWLLDRDGALRSAPVAEVPPEVRALLNISPFTDTRVGAGDPVVPGATYQPFRDIRIGEEMAVALYIGDTQAWPTV